MRREIIPASEEHKKNFDKTWKLRSDLVGNPEWEAAFQYARDFKLYPDEMAVIGSILVKRDEVPE